MASHGLPTRRRRSLLWGSENRLCEGEVHYRIVVDGELTDYRQVVNDRERLFCIRIVRPRVSNGNIDPVEIVGNERRSIAAVRERQFEFQFTERRFVSDAAVAELI